VSAAETEVRARTILDDLIRQRHGMEAEKADAGSLEANRLAIVYWRVQLDRALEARRADAA
jgi:hypothetical protein